MFDNTVGSLDSLPVEIQEFYQEEVRTEPTGYKVSEEYTYTDDEGTEQTATRHVPETTEVTYLVRVPVNDLKSWSEVDTLITKHKGKRDHLIEYAVQKAQENDLDQFHDNYLSWLNSEPAEAERMRDEDGTYASDDPETEYAEHYVDGITPEIQAELHADWQNKKPVRPNTVDFDTWKKNNYIKLRAAAYPSKEEQLDMQFHDYDGWKTAIQEIKTRYPKHE